MVIYSLKAGLFLSVVKLIKIYQAAMFNVTKPVILITRIWREASLYRAVEAVCVCLHVFYS